MYCHPLAAKLLSWIRDFNQMLTPGQITPLLEGVSDEDLNEVSGRLSAYDTSIWEAYCDARGRGCETIVFLMRRIAQVQLYFASEMGRRQPEGRQVFARFNSDGSTEQVSILNAPPGAPTNLDGYPDW